jgi:hypothetical protein
LSKVAIQGDPSGSGTFTIASPNSNSNFTLTLPQANTTVVGTDATQTLTNKTIDGSQLVAASVTSTQMATAVQPIGVGQTWTNVTGTRATGTTYTNSTGRPIMVVVTPVASGGLIGTFNIAGSAVGVVQFTPSGGGGGSPFFYIIPNGVTYSVTNNSNFNINYWWELR